MAAGRAGLALLPSGQATFDKVASLEVDGPQGKKNVDLIFVQGTAQTPQPVWVENGKFFGALVGLGAASRGLRRQSGQDAGGAGCGDRRARASDGEEVPDRRRQAAGAVQQRQDVRRGSASASSQHQYVLTERRQDRLASALPRRLSCRPERASSTARARRSSRACGTATCTSATTSRPSASSRLE